MKSPLVVTTYKDLVALSEGQVAKDYGINARVKAIQIVTDQFLQSPSSFIWGVGRLSHRWNNGFKGKFGYFYPSDIGLIGATFVYGFLVCIAFTCFTLFLCRRTWKLAALHDRPVVTALQWFVLYQVALFVKARPLFWPADLFIAVFTLLAVTVHSAKHSKNS